MGRPGDTNVPTADLIALFESDASRRLRTHYQEVSATISTVSDTDTYDLPDDFLEAKEFAITGTDPRIPLTYVSADQLDDFCTTTGEPRYYNIEASSIRVAPTPDAVYQISIQYWGAIVPLSDSNTSNWLLVNFPDCYLYGSLVEAELFLGSDATDNRYQTFTQRREQAYQAILLADRKFRTGGGRLRMKSDFQMP